MEKQEKFMQEALKEAKKAYKKKEVPIGAVIVKDNKIIARAHNLRETKKNSLEHAEISAINKACKKLKNFRLEECEIYVTIEPCMMCAGAIIQSRIKKVFYGAINAKFGAVESIVNLLDLKTNHKVEYYGGICKEQAEELMKNFFKEIRK